jgi:hypothetical protein
MLSVDDSLTTPHSTQSISKITNIRPATGANGLPITTGDTTFYSFSGTKVMARATFDPKQMVDQDIDRNIFGKEDGKIYGELAILGLENYPAYTNSNSSELPTNYDNRSDRMPIMFGLNVPTFKLLDVLSLEAEYYKNTYSSDYYSEVYVPFLPVPNNKNHGLDSSAVHNWKWSIYAKKDIGTHVQTVLQFARDHRRAWLDIANMDAADFGDNLFSGKDWYFMAKIVYGF